MLNEEYYLWGAGTYGARTIEFMKDDLTFKAVIDSNPEKQGILFHGLPVISYAEAKKNLPDVKVVVALNLPTSVREALLADGLIENQDFFTLHDFIPRFHWNKNRSLAIKSVDFAVTTMCNMKCEGCLTYIHLAANRKHIAAEKIIHELDLLFSHVDFVMVLNICCGESLLNKELPDICSRIYERYADRYHYLLVQTNATIMPDDDAMHSFRKSKVLLVTSNYPENLKATERLTEKCNTFNVNLSFNYAGGNREYWSDYGNPNTIKETDPEKLSKLFKRCWKPGMGLLDGQLYICIAQMWSHLVAEVGAVEHGDAFDLRQPKTEASREELYKIISRQPPVRGYVSHCERCLSAMNPLKSDG